jgi:hypothetical protein
MRRLRMEGLRLGEAGEVSLDVDGDDVVVDGLRTGMELVRGARPAAPLTTPS